MDQPHIIRTMQSVGGKNEAVYTLSNGAYLGKITFEGTSVEAIKAMFGDFQGFIADQLGTVQIAGPDVRINGRKVS